MDVSVFTTKPDGLFERKQATVRLKDGSLLRQGNADGHRPAAFGLALDDREHTKDEPSERTLDLDFLRGRVELEVLHQLRDEGLHLNEPGGGGTCGVLVSCWKKTEKGHKDVRETPSDARADAGGCR